MENVLLNISVKVHLERYHLQPDGVLLTNTNTGQRSRGICPKVAESQSSTINFSMYNGSSLSILD